MKVLGINCGLHDAAAALIADGRIAAFAAEERFTRIKHDKNFPIEAIRYCLDSEGLSFKDIDTVAYSWDYFKFEVDKLLYHIDKTLEISAHGPEKALEYLATQRKRKAALYEAFRQIDVEVRRYFDCKFIKVEHHQAH